MNGPVFLVTFSGRNGPGVISVPGLKAGDIVEMATVTSGAGMTIGGDFPQQLCRFVVVDDELLQQSQADYSAVTIVAMISRRGIL